MGDQVLPLTNTAGVRAPGVPLNRKIQKVASPRKARGVPLNRKLQRAASVRKAPGVAALSRKVREAVLERKARMVTEPASLQGKESGLTHGERKGHALDKK